MKKLLSFFRCFLLLPVLILLLCFSARSAEGVRSGLSLCARTVLPALFPFFVFSSFAVRTGAGDALSRAAAPVMEKLFGVRPGAPALILGLLGGYPVGASVIASLRRAGTLTRDEAEDLLAFCCNGGPAFFFGVVGGQMYHSAGIGLLFWGIHVLSALLTGILLRRKRRVSSFLPPSAPPEPFAPALVHAIRDAGASSLGISAFIVFFAVLLSLLDLPRRIVSPFLLSAVTGIFELTSGLSTVPLTSPAAPMLISAMLAWGGFSVHFQTAEVLADEGVSMKRYFLGKLTQTVLASLITLVFLPLF